MDPGETEPRVAGVAGLMLFRKGIQPRAEDVNAAGEKWTTHRLRSDRNSVKSAGDVMAWDKAWETMALLLIGESLPDADALTGAYIMDKSKGRNVSYRLEVWAGRMPSTALNRHLTDALSAVKPKAFSIKA